MAQAQVRKPGQGKRKWNGLTGKLLAQKRGRGQGKRGIVWASRSAFGSVKKTGIRTAGN
jgi:hypothetical protein